ncbi:YafY family protein [Undibacterium cyanobacteriorum]|uniref:YafY family protein n=1 Tax=Undibacterium cyanobacteriorum TaxID=3073561 RepID=A0ABY9RFM5_9BURK|nr:YafY family protein [Undibacterium sp. 20NA77.5]WMW79648.1 YafY family protein [Undibacterium sp. 20NA77.5]
MNKNERLLQIITLLKANRGAVRAEDIAQQMRCSVRTIYRDMQSLSAAGMYIEGEAGVGFTLRGENYLPPLMFNNEEMLAILIGSKMVQAFTDPKLAQSAQFAEQKIRAILPERLKQQCENLPYRIPVTENQATIRQTHGQVRQACEMQTKLQILYRNEKDQLSQRIVWPLGIMGLTGKWVLVGWCELRGDYRNFRFDRIEDIQNTSDSFTPTKAISLDHYYRVVLGIQ